MKTSELIKKNAVLELRLTKMREAERKIDAARSQLAPLRKAIEEGRDEGRDICIRCLELILEGE